MSQNNTMTVTMRPFQYDDLVADSKLFDPFRFSEPCWMVPVYQKLPPILPSRIPREEILRREKDMAIKMVAADKAPIRLHHRSGISNSPDFSDVLNAMKTCPKDQAIVVTLDPNNYKDDQGKVKDKFEVVFANTLRRFFERSGLFATAYQSNKGEVTVKHITKEEYARNKSKKKSK
jgi:hypothetical protein